nr:hypothetical protein Itr_chr13CG16270 [Ipomoea trifida]
MIPPESGFLLGVDGFPLLTELLTRGVAGNRYWVRHSGRRISSPFAATTAGVRFSFSIPFAHCFIREIKKTRVNTETRDFVAHWLVAT